MPIKGYLALFFGVIAITMVLSLPLSFLLKKRGTGFARQSSYLLFFFSLFLIVFCTIILFGLPISFRPGQRVLNLQPLRWLWEKNIKQRIMTEIRPNIMIFIPLGFFTPIAFKQMRKFHRTALVAFGVTFSVEFFQYFIGRSSDIDDLIANLLGGIIGYGIFEFLSRFFKDNALWNKLTEA